MVFSVVYVYQCIILVMLYHALPWLNYVCKGQIHGYLKLIESVTPSPKPLTEDNSCWKKKYNGCTSTQKTMQCQTM